jgi:hypothetical protein
MGQTLEARLVIIGGDRKAWDALGIASNNLSWGTIANEFVLKSPDALFGKGLGLRSEVLQSRPLHSFLHLRPLVIAK